MYLVLALLKVALVNFTLNEYMTMMLMVIGLVSTCTALLIRNNDATIVGAISIFLGCFRQ